MILCAVVAYSLYIRSQITHLRKVQTDLVNRNRRDSLQLLRIQNDLNGLALAMRDMTAGDEPYPLTAWQGQFQRLRTDLEDAFKQEAELATGRTPEQRQYLTVSLSQLWQEVDKFFETAQRDEKQARLLIGPLQTREAGLSNAVARLLVENNQAEEQAALQIEDVYARVDRQVYIFLAATLIAIVVTGTVLIRWNREIFRRMEELSQQRSELAHKLINTQESTLQFISRELHDEFGQILTAIGSLLGRAERQQAAAGTASTKDLREVRDIAQSALDSVRSLSQALHPVILDEGGVESAIDWYLPTVERQNGIAIHFQKTGESRPITTAAGIHIYRILQEALNNVVRHSQSQNADVRLSFAAKGLVLEVEDHGKGLPPDGNSRRGIGLVAMRERAELLGGKIQWSAVNGGGTLVRLEVPEENLH